MKVKLFQKSTELKMDGTKSFTEKQKSSPANLSLVLAQSSNSSLDLCHQATALLQQHHVVLHVV